MKLQELKERVRLAWQILKGNNSNCVEHAKRELTAMGYYDGDRMNRLMAQNLVDLIRVFGTQGHSGFSASFCRQLFSKAAAYEPLGPLHGSADEWGEVSDGMSQNKRCGHVFKEEDEKAYDCQAVVFEYPDGCRVTGRYSRMFIDFPYTPRSVTAKVSMDATDEEKKIAAQLAWAQPA